ncbi:Yellow stripe-like protein [Striga asiatica]|uniref:Yellow stripe-like protein n=1 Tax=Striga asiatica TaxID=4170 RepID=A0A5A7PL98_STRAF|nr:Yellow stripe-like protein [Striga asiatica]
MVTTTTIHEVDLPGSAAEEKSKSVSVTTQHEEDLKRLPPWTNQITARGVFASLTIGIVYSVVVTKLNLTTGLVPNLNVSAALLAIVFVRTWTKLLEKAGFVTTPFTRQENTIIQTTAVACYSIAVGGGFGSYLLALDRITYEKAGVDAKGNSPKSYKELKPDWMIGFCFVVSFVGLFYFDFSMTYVGAGMICSHIVNLSLLLGAVLSYGIMWPLISEKKGVWFPQDIKESSMKSLSGSKVFIAVALILGDGLYNFVKTMLVTFRSMHFSLIKKRNLVAAVNNDSTRLNEVFLRDGIPLGSLVRLRPPLGRLHPRGPRHVPPTPLALRPRGLRPGPGPRLLQRLLLGPHRHEHGKQLRQGGPLRSRRPRRPRRLRPRQVHRPRLCRPRPGPQDGPPHPRLPAGQAVGTAVGCVVGPLAFFLYYKTFEIGDPNGPYKAPYAAPYRSMAALGAKGFSALPDHCLYMCFGFFTLAVSVNLLRDAVPERVGRVGREEAGPMVPAVASGLICGDGLWVLPSCVLAMVGIRPPICMSFLPGKGGL